MNIVSYAQNLLDRPSKPFPAYQIPVYNPRGATPLSGYKPADVAAGAAGKRVPMAVRTVTLTGLVTTYRFVPIVGVLIPLVWTRTPEQGLVTSNNSAAGGSPASGSSVGRRAFDYYGDFAFHVQIEGIGAGAFSKFDGVDVEIAPIEYRDSLDHHSHKRPGQHKFGNIKLSKGMIKNSALWDWCQAIMSGDIQRKNGTITVLPDTHDANAPEITYHFFQAWPTKWTGLRLDGKGGGTLVEELELSVDYISRDK